MTAILGVDMSNRLVQTRVSCELKSQADLIFASVGMKTSDAIRVFLQQSVNVGGLPFHAVAKIPNSETKAAIRDLKLKSGKKYRTSDEFFKDLEV